MGGALLLWALGSAGFAADHVRSVTAITEVYGDGQRLSAVVLEYDAILDTTKLKSTDFSVEGGRVAKAYANTCAAKASRGINGSFVVLELAPSPRKPSLMPPRTGNGPDKGRPPAGGGPKLGDRAQAAPTPLPLSAQVRQTGVLITASGSTYPAAGPWKSSQTLDLVVRDFRQAVFEDPRYPGQPLMYNLYVPKDYNPARKYPLVLFMHDAGVVSLNPTQTLTQGQGAIAFASPEAQARHACFVLAPQYDRVITDNTTTTDQMDITVDLMKDLATRYSIDTDRLYNTGQSMGGMVSIAMDIKYPELFAASFLVACQWDPAQVAPIANKPMWIVVSEGDTRAKPGEDAILEVLKPLGATVAQATWSAEASHQEIQRNVEALAASGTSIHYTVYQGGDHRYTWQYAYGMEGIRDWLFGQARTAGYSPAELSARGSALSRAGDPAGALPFLQQAASQGDTRAHELLGEAYASGRGVSVDYAKALTHLQAAAELGSPRAYTNLGLLYQDGKGVPLSGTKALECFEKATRAGDGKGPRWAGIAYLKGSAGIPVDVAKASTYFALAASRGDVTAHYYLGYLYEKGLVYAQDYGKAAECYAKAAPPQGHAEGIACSALGHLYEKGLGVVQDRATAMAWYRRGVELGDEASREAFQRLGGN